jgi:hypothetical protein
MQDPPSVVFGVERPLKSISSTYYEQLLRRYSFNKISQSQSVIREKQHKAFSNKKGLNKMLMILTPGPRFCGKVINF